MAETSGELNALLALLSNARVLLLAIVAVVADWTTIDDSSPLPFDNGADYLLVAPPPPGLTDRLATHDQATCPRCLEYEAR